MTPETRPPLAPLGPPWEPIENAPKDGRELLLAIDPVGREHALADTDDYTYSIGFNELEGTEVDCWKFAGWCWNHDHFVDGVGTPRYFQYLSPLRPT